MARLPALAFLFCTLTLVACATQQKPGEPPGPHAHALPAYATLAGRYNARVRRLERVAAPVSLVIDYPDESGRMAREQVEGNLQTIPPWKLSLRLDKVGQTFFYLGSNERRYWWFDLSKEPTAMVGEYARATPGAAARFGLLVHPLDLLELLAITPLPPPASSGIPDGANYAWSPDARLVVLELPGRWGVRRICIDPGTAEARHVDLLGADGRAQISADLLRYTDVSVRGEALAGARMPTEYDLSLPDERVTVKLLLSDPQNPAERMKLGSFDLDRLLRAYSVTRIENVDHPAPREVPK